MMNENVTVRIQSNFPQLLRSANKRFTATIYIDGEEYSSTASTRGKATSGAITAAEILGGYELHLVESTPCKTRHPLVEDLGILKNVAVRMPVFLGGGAWKWLKEKK